MDWTQFSIMLFTFTGLFFWNRSESRSDIRVIMQIIKGMDEEMKDFHGRLCSIEERYRNK